VSPERLQLLAQMMEAFDREGFEGLVPFLDADFEFHEPPEQPGSTVFYGPGAARKGWARWTEAWTEQRSEPELVTELPDGRILVLTHERMRGRDGVEVDHKAAHIGTLRGSKLLRLESYWDRRNALEPLGLREEDL
jgi:ketosteroid isomerase-like protein